MIIRMTKETGKTAMGKGKYFIFAWTLTKEGCQVAGCKAIADTMDEVRNYIKGFNTDVKYNVIRNRETVITNNY